MKTLDTLMEEYGFEPPFGLKIDTEGFEDQVIRGATNFLRRTEFVIAEVSVAERFVDSYTFAEFTELMDENDFFLWDVLGVSGVRFWPDPVFCTRCYESVSTDSSSSGFPVLSSLPPRSAAATNSAGVR